MNIKSFFYLPILMSLRCYSYNSFRSVSKWNNKNGFRLGLKKKSNDIMDNSVTGFDVSKSRKSISPEYLPKTVNQELYAKYLNDPKTSIVLGTGPAGSGKTLFACITAIRELMSGNVKKIILTRPIVPVEEEEIGFLPGNLIHKMDPWTRPVFDIFLEFYPQRELDYMLQTGVIEISPLAYMRGRTFKRSFIIADEMQNSSPNQMFMLTTRIGEKTKLVVTGDLKQSDRNTTNGLSDIMEKVQNYNLMNNDTMIRVVEMDTGDVRRSMVVSQILDIYKGNVQLENKESLIDFEKKPGSGDFGLDLGFSENNFVKKKTGNYSADPNNDSAMIPLKHYKF
jgi:phosphate starvation-inducible PhoH-like protein